MIANPQSLTWPLRSNIPAVKIADAPTLPLLPKSIDSTANLPTPEPCASGVGKATASTPSTIRSRGSNGTRLAAPTKLDPIDSSLFSVKQVEGLPSLLADEENVDEFGEFLLDAVQWL